MEVRITGSILNSTFMELMTAVKEAGLRVVIGGGYGLYLKREFITQHRIPTIHPGLDIGTRSTEDIDMFLDIEVIADPDQARAMGQVLRDLDFVVKEGAEYYQFVRSVDPENREKTVRVDFQTGPVSDEARARVRIQDDRRVRPMKRGMCLHAHSSPEALGIGDSALSFGVSCTLGGGKTMTCTVNLPQPFTYLMMKVKSFHDKDQRVDLPGALDIPGKHAWDVLRVLAMTTEAELSASQELSKLYIAQTICSEVAGIVRGSFGTVESPGTLKALTYGRRLGISIDRTSIERLLTLLAELVPAHQTT